VYLKGLNNADALDLIVTEMPATKERDEVLHFIRSSERGIMRGSLE
jgi:UDP-N-acetylglucosamine acyltransferase